MGTPPPNNAKNILSDISGSLKTPPIFICSLKIAVGTKTIGKIKKNNIPMLVRVFHAYPSMQDLGFD